MSQKDIGIIILAGGKSQRMGEDKGLIKVGGKTVVEYIIETCRTISSNIIIISNQNGYGDFGYDVHNDVFSDKGPLGGLYTGLMYSHHNINFVLSCDMPLVTSSLLKELLTLCTDEIDVVTVSYLQRMQPLISLYKKRILPIIETQISNDRLKMTHLFNHVEVLIHDASAREEKEFLNLNTISDLNKFKQII